MSALNEVPDSISVKSQHGLLTLIDYRGPNRRQVLVEAIRADSYAMFPVELDQCREVRDWLTVLLGDGDKLDEQTREGGEG